MTAGLLFAIALAAQDKCTLSGTVVDSITGAPLNKVEVWAQRAGRSASQNNAFTQTDSKGNFTLVNLLPGEYHLKGRRNGYIETYYGARDTEGQGTPLTLEAGQTLKDLRFKLLPFGVIAGTVRDQDGEPLARIGVSVRRSRYYQGRRFFNNVGDWVRTDDLGQYRIPDLPPGKYYVCAVPENHDTLHAEDHSPPPVRSREVMLSTIYPGVFDPAAAIPVEVGVGRRVTGVDIVISRIATQRVKGHVTVGADARLTSVSLAYRNSGYEGFGFGLGANIDDKGNFEFPAVPSGSYLILATAKPPDKPVRNMMELYFQQNYFRAEVPVQVVDRPVEHLQIAIESGAEVAGHVSVEAEKNSKLTDSRIQFLPDKGPETEALIHEDQKFGVSLAPGHYDVSSYAYNDFIVRAIQLEGKDITDDGLTIAGPGKVSLEIVFARDGGQIEGVVVDKDGQPVAGATVVLIPDGAQRGHAHLVKESASDQNGHYQAKNVTPGNYKLFAWADIEPGIWWDPDFLKDYESSGEVVKVKTKGHESVRLRLLPASTPSVR